VTSLHRPPLSPSFEELSPSLETLIEKKEGREGRRDRRKKGRIEGGRKRG
jgi:hypothetical protein